MEFINRSNGKVKPKNARYVVRRHEKLGFAVFSPEGVQVTEWVEREGAAVTRQKQLQTAADKRAKKQTRECITCKAEFLSEGIHNRMCNGCRARGGDVDSPASMGRISGIRRSA
jgi:hypothetical protein